jgi:hypothetical protein
MGLIEREKKREERSCRSCDKNTKLTDRRNIHKWEDRFGESFCRNVVFVERK